MNTEVKQLSVDYTVSNTQKIDFRLLVKSYLEILRQSVEKLNGINYVNHYLYFSMMQTCNKMRLNNPLFLMEVTKRLYLNSKNISETNFTLNMLDYLMKQYQNSEAVTITQETEKNIKRSHNEESCKPECKISATSSKISSTPKFVTTTRLARINFDLLPSFTIGNLIILIN
jgi:hypothetical protein